VRINQARLFRLALFLAVVVITRVATAPLEEIPILGLGDKVLHAGAFLVLAALLDFAFPATAFGARKIVALLAYGMTIEIVQHFLPFRTLSLLDWLADAGGVALYVAVATPILKRTPYLQRRWAPQVSQ
jgi:VanZ family protein